MPCSLSATASAEPRATCSMRRRRLRGAHCSLPPAPPSPPSSSGHGSSSACFLFSLSPSPLRLVSGVVSRGVRRRDQRVRLARAAAIPQGILRLSGKSQGSTETARPPANPATPLGYMRAIPAGPPARLCCPSHYSPLIPSPNPNEFCPASLQPSFLRPLRPHSEGRSMALQPAVHCSDAPIRARNDHVTVEIFSENTSREPPQCLPQTGDPAWRCGSPHCTTDCH